MIDIEPWHLYLTAGAVAVLALYGLHQFALPRPIPGIPYRKQSANRILGDLPDVSHMVKRYTDSRILLITGLEMERRNAAGLFVFRQNSSGTRCASISNVHETVQQAMDIHHRLPRIPRCIDRLGPRVRSCRLSRRDVQPDFAQSSFIGTSQHNVWKRRLVINF